ncbi:hypothetical protein PaeCFBP13512_23260, partial [Paenibacillus sp. CFBP13512]|uniref:hypothetical protein n=1 Tax=Paenibacillus sp. CFBP13512 TaxID=2184007 RepID=UPI00113AF765
EYHHNHRDFVFLKTDFEKVEIDTEDKMFKDIRYLKINNVVRFLNPKIDLRMASLEQSLGEEIESVDDFDTALTFVEDRSEKFKIKQPCNDIKKIFFLPTHIEAKLKSITCNNQKNKIDFRLKDILPEYYIKQLGLNFKPPTDENIVNYDSREKYSISLFKFYNVDNTNECNISDTEKKINEVKYRLNSDNIDSFDYYFIGDIDIGTGLIERNEVEHTKDPLYYHFNFWKLKSYDILSIINKFHLYPFDEEVLLNEY